MRLNVSLALWFLLACAGWAFAAPALPTPETLRKLASEYYRRLDEARPVLSSLQGLHTWDDRLTDFSPPAIAARRQLVRETLAQVSAMRSEGWSKDDRIDWLLFRSQIEDLEFRDRVLDFPTTNPQVYVDECANGIFSLLKTDYAPRAARARSAAARLRGMPALLEQGKKNLTRPVRLYARLAIDAARSIDPLLRDSLATLVAEVEAKEREELFRSRDEALRAIHGFADWLEKRLPGMVAFVPMGEERYNEMLRRTYLLPLDARQVEMLGQAELARYRALESLLPDPRMADPDPARAASIPKDQETFLRVYESRQAEIASHLLDKRLVTLPSYLGPFSMRQLPEAFKPTSPGGFMNPPGVFDTDPSGFYFIPTYDPKSSNFYMRAAIEDPRPILAHEGIPGHFLQISIANHLPGEIRRRHADGVLIEGWALYTEEMLLRTGLFAAGSAAEGQVLRLSRYRAARIGVDVGLHTGRLTFEEAVRYFMEAGGLDREAAEGEAALSASDPTQKITYMVGKWQVLRLLGLYRERVGKEFRLGAFHDDLLKHGSLPLSIVEWILLDDATTLEHALGKDGP